MHRFPPVLLLAALVGLAVLTPATATPPATPAQLRADTVRPGEPLHVTGTAAGDEVRLQVRTPTGDVRGPYGPFGVRDGRVDATLPAAATDGVTLTDHRAVLALQTAGAGAPADAGRAQIAQAPAGAVLENSFVSAVGWVKPGEAYPFTLRVKNFGPAPVDGGQVRVPAVDGARFTSVGPGARLEEGAIVWDVGEVAGTADAARPAEKTLLVEAKAATLQEDARVVWRDLSTTATGPSGAVRSHGPKVIPPSPSYDTARYGDRPFPVVPVEYQDRDRAAESAAETLSKKINDPANPGSTLNLYQEMSYGQLFPNGTVPSAGVATAGWDYGPGFEFTKTRTGNTCQSPTTNDAPGEVYKTRDRITNGWYRLPGTTGYYGADGNGSALIGAQTAIGALQQIDSGCGPAGKSVYDAAQIADPELDYDSYDTDKDGVVDFFMMVFPGIGGNGESQTQGYDNIWPHSSTLEDAYVDAKGQRGYVSDDQRTDVEGRPLWYRDESFTQTTTEDKGDALKAFARVGPYNVNPESSITHASVISHEYGHSLGMPDMYSTGNRSTYGSWNLMATDHSQNMDVFGRQELGWLVPRVLEPGSERTASNWATGKADTHRIDWQSPDGKPYTLEGPDVHNGEAYVAKLPQRQIISPDQVPSGTHLFWSQAGNDFGCPPTRGHNLDIDLKALAEVPAGTKVTLTFKSSWQIEWDYDYGFVLGTGDGGRTYQSFESAKGYSTPQSQNPNASACQQQYGNGLTGTSGSHNAGNPATDRVLGDDGSMPFVDDEYDLSALAGKASAIRFAYATDAGFARRGWFIDDVKVTAGDRVIYSSDSEQAADPQVFNGGCREGLQTGPLCTKGWQYVTSVDGDPADHAYYMEMRDRSGFDLDGHGEDERNDPSGPTFEPGLSLVYTDENHGYGNVGTDDPPAQTPLDARPQPGEGAPNLDDAAFRAVAGRNRFTDGGTGHVDNYTNPAENDTAFRLAFDCLSFRVTRMTGDTNGPSQAPGDLSGDAAFTLGRGCAPFDYGYQKGSNEVSTPGVDSGAAASGAQACKATSAYRRARLRRARRGLRFDVSTRSVRYRADVFLVTSGRRVRGQRLVARFRGRRGAFSWNGRGQGARRARDGYYVVKLVTSRGEVRRFAARRVRGRWSVRPAFDRSTKCGLVRQFRATRPVFGGRSGRPLDISYRLGARSQATVVVARGRRVLRTFQARTRSAGRTYRQRITALRVPRGDVRVLLRVKSGKSAVTSVLAARRL